MNALVSQTMDLAPPRDDPAELSYPATLPVEIAMRVAPIRDICAAYGISREEWDVLRANPAFQAHVQRTVDALKREPNLGFKWKAQLQAEELLKTSWKLIHSEDRDVPASVRADLIKFTVKAAGLDASKEAGASAPTLNIQINL